MRAALKAVAVGAILAGVAMSASCDPANGPVGSSRATPLILGENEGEHRVWRPVEGAEGWNGEPGPFILKVDRHNGGSSRLVLGTEDIPPGATIDRHRHPSADEILLLQNGTARVSLGDRTKDVQGGATVFVPANTWIAVTNTGTDAIHCTFVFSAPGFEDYMRAASVAEGEKITPLSKADDARIAKAHARVVIYAEP